MRSIFRTNEYRQKDQPKGARVLKSILFLFFIVVIFSCSKQEISKSHSVNTDTDGLIAYAEDSPETLAGGDGITIGNGNSNDGELDEEVAKPAIIIGSYLTCSIIEKNIVSCSSETMLSESDLEQIILIDQNGNEISNDDIEINFVDHGESFEMILTVSSDVELEEIKESPDSNIDESAGEPEPESEPEPQPEPEALIDESEAQKVFCDSIGTPGSWILVPEDPDYGTDAFCVMKYEAKNVSGVPTSAAAEQPWANISQLDAIAECASLGDKYHLITNAEWMTISTNIAGQGSNWSSGSVGGGELARGHTDGSPMQTCAADANDDNAYVEPNCATLSSSGTFNQRRTHTLSNGEVIWDLAGNIWEWTSLFNDSDKPYDADDLGPVGNWREYTLIDTFGPTMSQTDLISQAVIDNAWNSSSSIGQYLAASNGSGGALVRGGTYWDNTLGGVFAAMLNQAPTNTNPRIGFRCAIIANP